MSACNRLNEFAVSGDLHHRHGLFPQYFYFRIPIAGFLGLRHAQIILGIEWQHSAFTLRFLMSQSVPTRGQAKPDEDDQTIGSLRG
ncbi:hypothetical protein DFR28_101171 [Arenicella xantha]|uniref:Uncharacterized protein n=1 Tax=Arenicella xantha TaxID=644221 RepID=A0A395JMT7_9GAMM|nr:hypothetical protein DFR28_101171 [Arenicella xantha]